MTKHGEDTTNPHGPASAPTITVDYDLYAHYLEDADLTEEQKREFLQALWSIITEFVALGFNVHPAQQAQNSCGKLPDSTGNPPATAVDTVDCRGQFLVNNLNEPADPERDRARKESKHETIGAE